MRLRARDRTVWRRECAGQWQRRLGGPRCEVDLTWPTLSTEQLTGGRRRCGRAVRVRRRVGCLQRLEQLGLLRAVHAIEELLHLLRLLRLLLLRCSRLLVGLPLPASDLLHEPFVRQPELHLPPARRRGLRLLSAQLLAQRRHLRLQLAQRLLVAARALLALRAWRACRPVSRERLRKSGAQSQLPAGGRRASTVPPPWGWRTPAPRHSER